MSDTVPGTLLKNPVNRKYLIMCFVKHDLDNVGVMIACHDDDQATIRFSSSSKIGAIGFVEIPHLQD